jgi:hypothetical protein
MFAREQLAHYVLRERYLDKLLALFEDMEDLEDQHSLELLGAIMKAISGLTWTFSLFSPADFLPRSSNPVYTNESAIYEYITRDDMIEKVVGTLECEGLGRNHLSLAGANFPNPALHL